MDSWQRKTRNAIFQAFTRLLEQKTYSSLTVQEIIDEADISRSTFYAHFETKDELGNINGNVFAFVSRGCNKMPLTLKQK